MATPSARPGSQSRSTQAQVPAKGVYTKPQARAAPEEEVDLLEGEHDLLDENVRARRHGDGGFEKTPRFTGKPNEEELRQLLSKLGVRATPEQKKGAGFKAAFAITHTKGWILRVRHYAGRKYRRCLEYQGYCPMDVAEELTKKERAPSDSYCNNVIMFLTDIDGNPTYNEDGLLLWTPAYTILGGKKMEAVRSKIQLYDNNPAGLVLQTELTRPDFGDFDITPMPDRSKFAQDVLDQLCVMEGEGRKAQPRWRPEILAAVEEGGLPADVRVKFLCQEDTAVDLIAQLGLKSQEPMLEKLMGVAPRAADSVRGTTRPADRTAAARSLAAPPPALDAADEEPGDLHTPEHEAAAEPVVPDALKGPAEDDGFVPSSRLPAVVDEL